MTKRLQWIIGIAAAPSLVLAIIFKLTRTYVYSVGSATIFKFIVVCCLSSANLVFSGTGYPESQSKEVSKVKLLFSSEKDITGTWGKLHFGATPIQLIRSCEDPGFTLSCCLPREDGTWDVYGYVYKRDWSKEGNWLQKKHGWTMVRATTRDGEHFENVEEILKTEPGRWTDHTGITYNPKSGEFLALKCTGHPKGFAILAFFSSDGRNWEEHPENPMYTDGDSLSVFWSPKAGRFISTNKSYQAVAKHIPDHGVHHEKINGRDAQSRRVCVIRWSRDGRSWEPSDWVSEHWGPLLPEGLLIVPDENDPPEMEFYRGIAFWYHDRAFLMMLNYAGSALKPGNHGPQLDTEWWYSPDGLEWERPYRDVNATPGGVRIITHNPMIIDGKILFHFGDQLFGMKQDRISYVGARANAEFSTILFEMPEADISLNAAVPSPDRAFATDQAYIMVAAVDEEGNVIPGFEREKCVIQNEDRVDLPLRWDERSARELAGRMISLRFYLRSANVYAVSAQ